MHGFAVHCEIEALALHVLADPQSDNGVERAKNDQRHDGVIGEDDGSASSAPGLPCGKRRDDP